MKSIKQQYIDLREGNMSQANFMRSIRLSLPQYVTNITSFNDSVKILKNKGILTEADMNMDSSELAMGIKVEMEHTEDMAVAKKIAMDHLAENPKYYSELKVSGTEKPQATSNEPGSPIKNISSDDVMSLDVNLNRANPRDGFTLGFYEGEDPNSKELEDDDNKYDPGPGEDENFERNYDDYDADYEEPNEPFDIAETKYNSYADVVNAISKKYSYKVYHDEIEEFMQDKASLDTIMAGKDPIAAYEEFYNIQKESINEAKDEKGKWTNASGKELYAQFKEIDNLNGQEVLIGIDFEMQKNHKLSKLEAAKIVVKNLKKNSIYYTAQDMSGVEGYEIGYIGGKSADAEARQMQYLDKNMGNVVDKKMGMKPVKDVEKVKKDSNKGGETNKTVKGVSSMSLVAKSVRGLQKMDATGEKIKKITMKEGMENDEVAFENLMKKYDWYAEMSDDSRKWDAQQDMERQLKQIAKTISAEKAVEIWNRYAPENNRKVDTSFFEMRENKVAKTIFDKNANITKGINNIAKGEDNKKKLKEYLKEMIRKEIAGAYGGDAMDAEDGSSYINKD